MTWESYTYELSIVIVSYNTKDLLRECLQSVEREAAGLSTEIFLVDNNSSDGSPLMVETEFPQVKVMRSTINLGFGAANNLALEAAQGRYIVLLNSDAFLSDGSLRIARDHMNASSPRGAWRCTSGGPGFLVAALGTHVSPCHQRRSCAYWPSRKISKIKDFWTLRPDLGRSLGTISSGLGPRRLLDYSGRSA